MPEDREGAMATTTETLTETLQDKRRRAGRMGGMVTYFRYGSEGMAERGRLGGRPRSITIDDIRQSQSLNATESKNEGGGMDTPRIQTNSLVVLKRLWRDRQRSTAWE